MNANRITKIKYGYDSIILDFERIKYIRYKDNRIHIRFDEAEVLVIDLDKDDDPEGEELRIIFMDLYTRWRNYIEAMVNMIPQMIG